MKYFYSIVVFLTGFIFVGCNSFSGILFPKVHFSITPVGIQPPCNANDRLKAGDLYPQTFTFLFSQAGNSFTAGFIPTIFVSKPYDTLYVKEMKYEYDNNTGIFIDNKIYKINTDSYITFDDWYWIRGIGDFLDVKFEKIFFNKKPGDKFAFKITIIYSFDNTVEQVQVLEYDVVATKGTYTSLFMGF